MGPPIITISLPNVYTNCPHDLLHTGTRLGPYFGKAVKKEEMEEDAHEWLWEV